MKLRAFCLASTLTASALTLSAQSGPVSGLLVDRETHAVRPIIGLPGSAYAQSASLGAVDFAAAAPDGNSALLLKDGSLYHVRDIAAAEPAWRVVRLEAGSVEHAAFSPDSASVALYDKTSQRLDFLSGLGGGIQWRDSVDLSGVAGTLASLAVSTDAKAAFAIFQESDEVANLYLLNPGQAPRQVYTLAGTGAIAFERGALWVADRGRNEILRISNWDTALALTTVASEALGVNGPVGVALADNGRTLLVANGEARQVVAIDLAQGEVKTTIELGFTPTGFSRSGTMLLLASGVAGEQPAQVLDPARMQVFFVPVSKDVVKPAPADGAEAE